MRIELRDEMFSEYFTRGYLILRNVIPPALLKDLRREAAKARDLAYELHGPMMQRLQPIAKYADKIDQKPFQDYCELQHLGDAVRKLLGFNCSHGHRDVMGILIEPRDQPWNQGWHRDGPVEVPLEAQDEILMRKLGEGMLDARVWNQVNCALYNDCCTWYVPGSHLRARDLPGERQTLRNPEITTELEGLSNEEREIRNIQHARHFPGAVQTQLGPGDYMIYRNMAWHCGNYVHYQPRATIHDYVKYIPDGKDDTVWGGWWEAKQAAIARMEERKKAAASVAK
jgi:hypothetical protein